MTGFGDRTMTATEQLIDVLRESQRLGFLGERPVEEVIEHARAFCVGLDDLRSSPDRSMLKVLDLGAGGGVPGFVIAFDRPDLQLTLLDRRVKRTDFLERMARRLGWHDRVTVASVDAVDYAATHPQAFDAVVARGFGPPEITLGLAVRLVRPAGRIVISEPPTGNRWTPALLDRLGVRRLDAADRVAVFTPDPAGGHRT